MSDFSPLKITARLQCGVIADGGICLDAPLLYYALLERDGSQVTTTTEDCFPDTTMPVRLPFAIHNEGQENWFYACSQGQWSEPKVDGTDYWNKRFDLAYSDLIDFGGKRGQITTSYGQFKPYHMPVFYRHALSLAWYCVGDKIEIARLLPFITNLGKKASQGWGAVLAWDVQDWHADWSIYDDTGRLMRPIPNESGPLFGIRPPYRLTKNQFPCQIPT